MSNDLESYLNSFDNDPDLELWSFLDDFETMIQSLTPAEFKRLHTNQWIAVDEQRKLSDAQWYSHKPNNKPIKPMALDEDKE